MTEIQQNRWDQLVRRVANITSPGSMVNDSLTELFPVLDVETLKAELLALSGTRIAFGAQNHASSAGDLNHAQIFNPENSGAIITVTRVDFRAAATMDIRYAMAVLPLTDLNANEAYRDGRLLQIGKPVGQLRSVQQAAGIPIVGSFLVEGNITRTMESDEGLFVLSPGTGITWATTVTGTASIFSFMWRERVAEPAELNF